MNYNMKYFLSENLSNGFTLVRRHFFLAGHDPEQRIFFYSSGYQTWANQARIGLAEEQVVHFY